MTTYQHILKHTEGLVSVLYRPTSNLPWWAYGLENPKSLRSEQKESIMKPREK